jgi:hypothetical protein
LCFTNVRGVASTTPAMTHPWAILWILIGCGGIVASFIAFLFDGGRVFFLIHGVLDEKDAAAEPVLRWFGAASTGDERKKKEHIVPHGQL